MKTEDFQALVVGLAPLLQSALQDKVQARVLARREEIAIQAMRAIISRDERIGSYDDLARTAFGVADAMLKQASSPNDVDLET